MGEDLIKAKRFIIKTIKTEELEITEISKDRYKDHKDTIQLKEDLID